MISVVSRRIPHWLVVLTALLLAAVVASACGAPAAAPAAEEAAPAAEGADEAAAPADDGALEAPQWVEMVAAGELPPLEERLPANPKVLEPLESIGQYGGTMRHPLLGSWSSRLYSFMGNENLVIWTPNWDGLVPNVAESWDVNEDSSEFIFHLREGIKWSDGELFTADDIMFWYNDIVLNEDITPALPSWLTVNDEFVSAGEDRRLHDQVLLRRALRSLPAAAGHARRFGHDGVPRALREAVPRRLQHREPGRDGGGIGTAELGGTPPVQDRDTRQQRRRPGPTPTCP